MRNCDLADDLFEIEIVVLLMPLQLYIHWKHKSTETDERKVKVARRRFAEPFDDQVVLLCSERVEGDLTRWPASGRNLGRNRSRRFARALSPVIDAKLAVFEVDFDLIVPRLLDSHRLIVQRLELVIERQSLCQC